MISTPSLHPFFSHFPFALFVAGLILLYLGQRRNQPHLLGAASLNFTFGLLAAVLASLTGMLAADLQLRPVAEVEGHQGFAFGLVVLFAICTVYSYTARWSHPARWFYFFNFLMGCATLYSGYALVFQGTG